MTTDEHGTGDESRGLDESRGRDEDGREYATDGGPFDVTIRVGEVRSAERFPEARKPELFKLEVDLGDRTVRSAAQLGYHHEPEDVVGRQVLCAVDLGTVNVAGFVSEALTVGVPGDDGNPVLVCPTEDVPLGGALY
jgi:tRNA-binding protein